MSHKYNAADSIPREALVVNDPKYCLSKEELASLKHGEVTIADAEKLRLYYEFCKLDWKSAHEWVKYKDSLGDLQSKQDLVDWKALTNLK